jgi:hypothetical protein
MCMPLFSFLSRSIHYTLYTKYHPLYTIHYTLYPLRFFSHAQVFGSKVTEKFNHINNLELICRAHQLVNEGHKYMFPEKDLVTVWSAPNYCYRCGNVASILSFDEHLDRDIKTFEDVQEQNESAAPSEIQYFF